MTENETPVETPAPEVEQVEAELYWQVTARAHEDGNGSHVTIDMREAFGDGLPEQLRLYALGKALRKAADSLIESAVAFTEDDE